MSNQIDYRQWILHNGLRVVCAHRPWSKTFAAILHLRVGFRDEPDRQTGISHLVEHLVFHGPNGPLTEDLGRQGLELNGQTAWEETLFPAVGHADLLDGALDFFLHVLEPIAVDPRVLGDELQILSHELAGHVDTAGDRKLRRVWAQILGDAELARKPASTTTRDLPRMQPEHAERFHHEWYAAGNASLTIVSPVATDELSAIIDNKLGAITARPGPQSRRPFDRDIPPPLTVRHFDGSHALVMVGHPFKPSKEFPLPVIKILNDYLGAGSYSVLFRRIRHERQMAYQVASELATFGHWNVLNVSAVVARQRVYEAIEQIVQEISRMQQHGLDASDLEMARSRVLQSFDLLEDSPHNLCESLARSEPMPGIGMVATPNAYRQALRSISAEQVSRACRLFFHPSRRVVVLMGPVQTQHLFKVKQMLGLTELH